MTTSCSWCHTMNDASFEFCATCGHQAHESRMNCHCEQCRPPRWLVDSEVDL